jgi:hypothetical protein
VVQTGIGAAAAIGGGFIGVWLQGRYQRQADRDRRRERAAEVVGDAIHWLADARPNLLHRLDSETHRTIVDLEERLGSIRRRLLVLAAGHPNPKVRELVEQLHPKMASTMEASKRMLREQRQLPLGKTGVWALDPNDDYANAERLVTELLKAI